MLPRPIIALLEAWLIQQLLRTPGFHRLAHRVASTVHRARHGTPADELGGTKLDDSAEREGRPPGFARHFLDEVRTQLGAAEREEMRRVETGEARRTLGRDQTEEEENAEGAWRKAEARLRRRREEEEEKKKEVRVGSDAETVWREAGKTKGQGEARRSGGFLDEYMEALREQVRQNKKSG